MRIVLVALVAACWTGEPAANVPAPAPQAPPARSRPRVAMAPDAAVDLPDASAGSITARVIAVHVAGNGLVVVVSAGTDQGVARTWHVSILGPNGAPIPNAPASIIIVDKRQTVVRVGGVSGLPHANLQVVLSP